MKPIPHHQWMQQAIAAGAMQAQLIAYLSFAAYLLRLHGRQVEFVCDEVSITV